MCVKCCKRLRQYHTPYSVVPSFVEGCAMSLLHVAAKVGQEMVIQSPPEPHPPHKKVIKYRICKSRPGRVHRPSFTAGVSNGVFFDIGANDGINISNTYYFEKVLNWTGIAIEPLPRAYKQLLANRRCFKVNGCVTDYDGETKSLEIQGDCEMLSGISNRFNKQHARRVRNNLKRYQASSHEIVVPCYTLASLLSKHGIAHVNYLSIDTEGGEFDILQAIDFQDIEIDVVNVENNHFGSVIEDFMAASEYDLVAIGGVDEIYHKRNRRIAVLPRQMAA